MGEILTVAGLGVMEEVGVEGRAHARFQTAWPA
jgi:hypothetical protein